MKTSIVWCIVISFILSFIAAILNDYESLPMVTKATAIWAFIFGGIALIEMWLLKLYDD